MSRGTNPEKVKGQGLRYDRIGYFSKFEIIASNMFLGNNAAML